MPVLSPDDALAFVRDRHRGVLATIRSDGRPQLSNVLYALVDGRVRVSTTAARAKAGNARRDPRVSLHVTSEDFWTYVVAEGRAELSPVASSPGDETCRALLRLYEAVRGEAHPDPEEFHAAMVEQGRVELSFGVERCYPLAGT